MYQVCPELAASYAVRIEPAIAHVASSETLARARPYPCLPIRSVLANPAALPAARWGGATGLQGTQITQIRDRQDGSAFRQSAAPNGGSVRVAPDED